MGKSSIDLEAVDPVSPEAQNRLNREDGGDMSGRSPSLPVKIAHLKIAGHARQPDDEPVEVLPHFDLAAQPAGLGQAKGQVEHVVLVVRRLGNAIVVSVRLDDDMARRTGTRPAARALHLEVVGLSDVEKVIAVGDGEGVVVVVLVDECDFASGRGRC